jgi:RNA polymerase primary sigma factor
VAPERDVERREDLALITKLLESIDERDARVLRLRFGLEGKEPLTLKEIGQEVGLTRERVRQIEVEALKKLQQQLNDDRPTRFFRENMPVEAPRKRPGRKRKDAPPQG